MWLILLCSRFMLGNFGRPMMPTICPPLVRRSVFGRNHVAKLRHHSLCVEKRPYPAQADSPTSSLCILRDGTSGSVRIERSPRRVCSRGLLNRFRARVRRIVRQLRPFRRLRRPTLNTNGPVGTLPCCRIHQDDLQSKSCWCLRRY
jgi:hypothetical protein